MTCTSADWSSAALLVLLQQRPDLDPRRTTEADTERVLRVLSASA
ncbi:hypothetical protein [Streptomyces eurythermus]